MKGQTSIGIIGMGKLGSALAKALQSHYQIEFLVDQHQRYHDSIKSIEDIKKSPDICFLTVQDAKIEETAKLFSEKRDLDLSKTLFIHCSGLLDKNELISLLDKGAKIAAAHPYQTFYYEGKDPFNGIAWGIDADEEIAEINEIITFLQGNYFYFDQEKKKKDLYHMSAVVASNFMTPIISLSKIIADAAGIPVKEFLAPIIKTTIENNLDSEVGEFPLTGPIARGDIATLKIHLKALDFDPHFKKAYCYFALATLEISHKQGILDNKILCELREILVDSCFNRA
jgi:predicted short-subunit dehydrogenase-like oxidoreductase (DUF2520 family)